MKLLVTGGVEQNKVGEAVRPPVHPENLVVDVPAGAGQFPPTAGALGLLLCPKP